VKELDRSKRRNEAIHGLVLVPLPFSYYQMKGE